MVLRYLVVIEEVGMLFHVTVDFSHPIFGLLCYILSAGGQYSAS
jgi:hypothetical protein